VSTVVWSNYSFVSLLFPNVGTQNIHTVVLVNLSMLCNCRQGSVYAMATLNFTVASNASISAATFAESVRSTLQSYLSSSGNLLAMNMDTLKIYGIFLTATLQL
jgi:hypothetical protein